jgi:hypothetical protein
VNATTTDDAVDTTTTTTTDDAVDTTTTTTENYFSKVPESWRTDLISASGIEGDDVKALSNMLERVPDIKGLVGNYKSMQDKIRKGEISSGLPEGATPEQVSAWRAANGVPESFDKYDIKLPAGSELSDDEKEVFQSVFEAAHKGNVSNEVLNGQIAAYKAAITQVEERRQQQDGVDAQQAAQVLKESWGAGEYEANMNRARAVLNQLPDSIREQFTNSRMSDGRAMMNSPEVLEFFAALERERNPAGTVVPGANNPVKAIADEIKSIENLMKTDPTAYEKDKPMQARLLELYKAEEQMARNNA